MGQGIVGAASAVLTLALFATGPSTALAAGAGSPGVRPSTVQPHGYFEATAKPGDVIRDSFVMTDLGDASASFLVAAVDGSTSPNSGIVYSDRSRVPTGPGAWITVPSAPFALTSHQAVTVPFTVTVPRNASPGDHVAAVSAENPVATTTSPGAGFAMSTTQRTVVAVVIHIPGPVDRTSVSVGQPTIATENAKRQILTLPLAWSADVIGKPVLAFTVTDASGKTVVSHPSAALDSFIPKSAISFPVPLDNVLLAAGRYCIAGTFAALPFHQCFTVSAASAHVPAPGQRGPHTAPSSSPGLYLAGAATVFLLDLILLTVLRRRRRNRA